MPSTKRHVSRPFLILAGGRRFLAIPINKSLAGAWLTSLPTGLSRDVVERPMTFWTVGAEDGIRKRSMPNGSALSSKRKTGYGKRGG